MKKKSDALLQYHEWKNFPKRDFSKEIDDLTKKIGDTNSVDSNDNRFDSNIEDYK